MGCGASSTSKPPEDSGKPLRAHADGKDINRNSNGSPSSYTEDEAAAKLQAVQRGRQNRKEMEEMNKSATIMQARFRGKKGRSRAANICADREIVHETGEATVKRNKKNSGVLSVNDWQFGKVLGTGAYGQVYLASKKGQTDQVAVKVLSRSILKRKRVGRFGSAYDSVMGEISVMKKLDHPNVVRLYEVIDDPEEECAPPARMPFSPAASCVLQSLRRFPPHVTQLSLSSSHSSPTDPPPPSLLFMVMEMVPGGDLSAPIEAKRAVGEEELRAWMTGLTLGLEHLHFCGVCHRDIKPENILYDAKTGQAKLSDFGISVFYKVSDGTCIESRRARGGW